MINLKQIQERVNRSLPIIESHAQIIRVDTPALLEVVDQMKEALEQVVAVFNSERDQKKLAIIDAQQALKLVED